MQSAEHWENVCRDKNFDSVSWYAPHLGESLRLIEQLCPDKTAAIVDIGGGKRHNASTERIEVERDIDKETRRF